MNNAYTEYNHPHLADLNISDCYLCDQPLCVPINKDHLIPNAIFPSNAANRPKLPVHKSCNDGKTLLDERFIRRIQFVTHLSSPIANQEVMNFLHKVGAERANQYLIGKKVRHLKLAKTLARDMQYKRDIMIGTQQLVQIDAGESHVRDLNSYASKMMKGLFIRNVQGVTPKKAEIKLRDLQIMTKSQRDLLTATYQRIINTSVRANSHFSQTWKNHIAYFGINADEENAGLIIMQLYNTYFIEAWFHP